jgi:hypothetical protein
MHDETLIHFTPTRHSGGYQLVSGLVSPSGKKQFGEAQMRTRTILMPRNPEARLERPKLPPDLYVRFARLGPGDEAVKAFADEFGLLGLPETMVSIEQGTSEADSYRQYALLGGESVADWRRHAAAMEYAVERWRLAQTAKPGAAKSRVWERHEPFAALSHLKQEINGWLCSLAMVETDSGRKLRLRVVPQGLLQAMWLQLAQDVSADRVMRECLNCQKWIVAAPGTRSFRRTTCSDSCRSRLYQRRHEPKPAHPKRARTKSR